MQKVIINWNNTKREGLFVREQLNTASGNVEILVKLISSRGKNKGKVMSGEFIFPRANIEFVD